MKQEHDYSGALEALEYIYSEAFDNNSDFLSGQELCMEKRDKIRAALTAQRWNFDMDAAPKDNTEILAVDYEGIIQVIRWSKHNHVPLYGWVRQVELYGEEVDSFDPIAWQPLPKPPQDGGDDDER